jgi:hypothetical protein
MNHGRQAHIERALTALAATEAHKGCAPGAAELVVSLSDLAAIAGLLGQLAGCTRQELADWATVGTHLHQAQEYAQGLARCLNHAAGTLAFNVSLRSVA